MNIYQKINRVIKASNVKLRKGRGYLYLTYDDGTRFDTHSIYWNDLNDATSDEIAHIIDEAKKLAARVAAR